MTPGVTAAATTCDHCGYDLAGRAFGETCPECGALIEPSRFRGGWRNHRARRQFVVGAWLLFAAAATAVLGAAWSMIVRLLDLERSAVGAVSGMATICTLASLIWLVPAARRIGMVRLLACVVVLKLAGEAAWVVPPLFGGNVPSQGVAKVLLVVVWSLELALWWMPLLIAQSAGWPTKRGGLVACGVVGSVLTVFYAIVVLGLELKGWLADMFVIWLSYGGGAVGPIARAAALFILIRGLQDAERGRAVDHG